MSFLDLLFPKSCLECGKTGKYVCEECLQKVSSGGWYQNSYAVFRYEGVIRKAIIALKYKFASQIADELAGILVPRIRNLNIKAKKVLLIPIPLHKQRENWRGFNQAGEIGKKISAKLGWVYSKNLLVKNKKTSPQVELKGPARRQNLQGAFVVNPDYSELPIGYSLVIFDDVATTGSTISEAKKALEKVGFSNIWGLTIAR